jgi:hypothetical protein
MIKYLVPFAGLLVLLVVLSYASAQTEEEKTDLEGSEFLFRPVYIRYGYHPHNSYGWKGQGGQGGQGGKKTKYCLLMIFDRPKSHYKILTYSKTSSPLSSLLMLVSFGSQAV